MSVAESEKIKQAFPLFVIICWVSAAFSGPGIGIYFFLVSYVSIAFVVIHDFVKQCVHKDFKRPVWLDILYMVAIFTVMTVILFTYFEFGDADILRGYGSGGLSIFGICISVEALLGILGFKVNLDEKGKFELTLIVLSGIFLASIGIAILVGWDGPWDSW